MSEQEHPLADAGGEDEFPSHIAHEYAEFIVETIREPLVILNADLSVRSANRSFYRTFRVSEEQTVGRFIYDLGNRQWDIPALRELLEEILPEKNPFDDFEVRHAFERIGQKTMLLNARRIEKNGEPKLILLAIEDITERRQAQEKQRASDEQLRRMIESVTDYAFFSLDRTGRVASWNTGAEHVFGYAESEILGRDCAILFTPEDRAAGVPALELAQGAETGRAADERWHLRKDGSRFFASGTVTSIVDQAGQCVGFTKIARDITERIELERSLRHRVRELADADERKNEFLAMLAHELRNPLAAIHNGVQLAQMPGSAQHMPEVLGIIQRQTTNLTRLIDDLLDVSRITQGKVELKKEPVELAPLIQRAADAVKPLIEQREHELTLQLAARPLRVEADPTRLEQVIVNLLTNAAKYSESGGHITVSAAREKTEAVIRVIDTGVGIPPELIHTIFDLFTQIDPSLDRSRGGMGIGLTLVKRLVELHGGSITVASKVGRGSEFTIRLPLLETAIEPVSPTQGPQVAGAGKKVLIVDDNADSAQLTGRLLHMAGFTVHISHDGKAAIEQARVFRPEVVLLDIGLPGMDGYAVARQLRREPCCHDSLIIGVSGYGDAASREQARQAGFNHHLVKPVDIGALTGLIAASPP